MGRKLQAGLLGIGFVVVGAGLFVAGWFGKKGVTDKTEKFDLLITDNFAENKASEDMEKVDGSNIRKYLEELASVPHMAGLETDENLALFIKNKWLELGLDQVDLKEYEVLLDYPSKAKPNLIQVLSDNKPIFESKFREDKLHEGDDHVDFVDSFLAYSAAGEAVGEVVYVNYGTKEDFDLISNVTGDFYVNVTGKICIVRYGQIFRGNKAQNCEKFGCSGMILFSDPADVAARGTEPENVYPHTFWLPGTGMQRGSLLLSDGDPMTPNAPSLPDVHRLNLDTVKETLLPKIPCQPIGYQDAKEIMKRMDGISPPHDWIGKIDGVNYNLGGKFVIDCVKCSVKISTNNFLEKRNVSNVIGVLKGNVEPDRYVIVGNHRDAWGFGAVDPSSGTAQMTEIIRVLGQKVKNENWRPRRTIIFANWGAEEYGLTGSREFVEEFVTKLSQRAVAYLNNDICTGGGDILYASASPTIKHKVIETTKALPSISNSSKTYFEYWRNWTKTDTGIDADPDIGLPGAGSDHASFIFFAGVPVIDFSFDPDTLAFPELSDNGYPAYHTGYETLYLVENLIDPDAKIRETCSKMSLRIIRDLADSIYLDFDPQAYYDLMTTSIASFVLNGVSSALEDLGVSIKPLEKSLHEFRVAIESWKTWVDTLDLKENPMAARYVNDQIMKLDRVFLLPQGLPKRPIYRHAIISPSQFDSYSSGSFPGISDLLYGYEKFNEKEKLDITEALKQHISDLMVLIHQAADHLKEVALI